CISGLDGELFYVREGTVNEYAMKFVVPVPALIQKLHFTWENLAGRPVKGSKYFIFLSFVKISVSVLRKNKCKRI
ncbi:Tyrosine-protein kinase Dnt, partial [Trachymyrmex septentrionalis]